MREIIQLLHKKDNDFLLLLSKYLGKKQPEQFNDKQYVILMESLLKEMKRRGFTDPF